ncbi:MAG: DUF1559 domain-containing protein [Armatimonadetes bacterium]|nr:DUF1559 domain-containing protein [Armatimonadota bacterium]
MNRTGFTLIELLVVIAIIAILAAILFPVFARAREKARQTTCLSNVKQLVTATGMYVSDNDGQFPMSAFPAGPYVATFNTVVIPYVKNDQLAQCPSEPLAMDVVAMFALYGGPYPGTPRYTSYTTNAAVFLNGYLLQLTGGTTVAESDLPRPADTILLYDGNVTQTQQMPVQARHNSVFNAGYADGHVKSLAAQLVGTTTQFTGATIPLYRIGATGGYYQGMTEAQGIPQ